jgi:ABC-type branched-subunit amino acid transport system substrate-binding protein
LTLKSLLRALACAASLAAGLALASGAPLVIGQTADFSGPQAAAVKETTAAARAYFDRVNKAGGVNGRPIVLESIPVTQENRIAVVAPVGGSELMHRPANHDLFNLRPPHKFEAEKKVQPDAVVGLCIPKSCAALVRAMRAKGLLAQFVSMSNTSSSGYVKDLGDDARGVIVTQVYPYPYNDATGAAKVMTEALRRAGAHPTPQSVIAALENLDYDVGNFPISFAGHGRSGNEFMEMTMISRGGRFIR